MSFWDELREGVRERTTTGDVSVDLFNVIKTSGVVDMAIIQPTFYLGRFYILSFDFMDFVEKLLSGGQSVNDVLRSVLYLRETASTMGRAIKNAAEPIEGMMTFIDPIYEDSLDECDDECDEECHCHDEECSCHDEDSDNDGPYAEFKGERDELQQSLQQVLVGAKVSASVAQELAQRIADTYCGCVVFIRALRTLNAQDAKVDMSSLMVCLVEIQYLMDTKLRRLLLEDVFMEDSPAFVTGLLPWISHAVEEMARSISVENAEA